jgi:DNA polymerase V
MGDIARCSLGRECDFYNENLLYKLFGVNAELLIDHAWGYEPVTIADIKAYKPTTNSMGSGQVLHCPYTNEKARLIVREMADQLVLDLVDKGLVTDQMVLTVGYDIENLTDPERRKQYRGEVVTDHYGRQIPKHAHGTVNLPMYNSSTVLIVEAVVELFDRITDPNLLVRRLNLVACRILPEDRAVSPSDFTQLDLFTDPEAEHRREMAMAQLQREKRRQQAVLTIKKRFGKNAIVKGMNLEDGATAMDRNGQIGGHKA